MSNLDLIKGFQAGASFELDYLVPEMTEYQGYSKPGLITSLLNPTIYREANDVFKYDVEGSTAIMPSGKRYDEVGASILKDTVSQQMFSIPSHGAQYSVKNRDIRNKRMPDGQPMTEEYLIALQQVRMMDGLDLLNEREFASVLTTDSMTTLGGTFAPRNYYNDLLGTGRGAKIDTDLGNTTLQAHTTTIEEAMDVAHEVADNFGRIITGFTAVCGRNYFNKYRQLEANDNLAREIRGVDLAQEGTPVLAGGDFPSRRFLEGQSGVNYVRASGTIGSKLIGDNDMYLVPSMNDNAYIAFAPTDRDRDLYNQEARTMYMWTKEDRHGLHVEMESNRLFGMKLPQVVTHFTTAS